MLRAQNRAAKGSINSQGRRNTLPIWEYNLSLGREDTSPLKLCQIARYSTSAAIDNNDRLAKIGEMGHSFLTCHLNRFFLTYSPGGK